MNPTPTYISSRSTSRPVAVLLTAAVALLVAGPINPTKAGSIAVGNFSFENPIVSGTGGFTSPPTDWTATGATNFAGTYNAVSPTQYPIGSNGLSGGRIVPDGTQAGYLSANSSLSQVLATALTANTTYTLTFYAGQRADPGFGATWASFSAVLFDGASNPIASTSTITTPDSGKWVLETLTFTTGNTVTGNIGIAFRYTGTSGQVNIDDVTLTSNPTTVSAPEPATMALAGIGIVGMAGYGSRRRQPRS